MKVTVNPRATVLDLIPENSVGAEIGVHQGNFSRVLLKRVKPRKLHLIDPWKYFDDEQHADSHYGRKHANERLMDERYEAVCRGLSKEIHAGVVEVHRMTSLEAAAQFSDEYFDFVYVDGDHTYSAVRADLDAYYPKVRPGGLIAGDDYVLDGWWGDGVVRAFHEFLLTKPLLVELKLGHQIVVREL